VVGRAPSLSGRALDGGRDGRIAAQYEGREPPLERRSLDQHVAAAGLAAKTDVGAESIDKPGVAAAWMASAKSNDVPEQQGHDRSVRHGGQGIRGVDGHGSA
jgi:hypothetical protein